MWKKNQHLRDDLSALHSYVELNSSESWRQDAIRLDRGIESLRDNVQKSTEMIWQQMYSQWRGSARHPPNSMAKVQDEPTENFSSRTPRENPRVKSPDDSSFRPRRSRARRRDSESEPSESDLTCESDVGSDLGQKAPAWRIALAERR